MKTKVAMEPAPVHVMPVVEVCNVAELAEECKNGAPVIHLIRSPATHPAKEAAHLQEEATQLPPGMTLEVTYSTSSHQRVHICNRLLLPRT